MSNTLPSGSTLPLSHALDSLVDRGTITADQRAAILAEVAGGAASPAPTPMSAATDSAPAQARRRRPLSEILIEVGLYVGGALVIAAAFVLVAQNWQGMSLGMQITVLAVTAVVAAGSGLAVGHGAGPGSARCRLAGVLFAGAAASAAGTTALLLGDSNEFTGLSAFAVALAVMVAGHLIAPSTITELGMFIASFAVLQSGLELLRPETVESEFDEMTTFDRYSPLALVTFGALWASLVSRRLAHRELAVFAGMAVALIGALSIIGPDETRTLGMVVMALLAATGFWGFLAQGYWPWLAAAIGSVTALVFWAVGGADRPALAILVAGLVMLGSSALGMLAARRRREAITSGSSPPP
jgi:hypothetical protein